MDIQVNRDNYDFLKYSNLERWADYYFQLKEIFKNSVSSVLEIGIGDGVVGSYLRQNSSIKYTGVDYAADVNPDIVADIFSVPVPDKSYDAACAFEVLEHIPFEDVPRALTEMSRIARKYLLVSVPHFGPQITFSCKLPLLPKLSFFWKIPYPKEHVWNGQHYWELGEKGYPASRLRNLLGKFGDILYDYVPKEAPYHHFFVIKIK